MPDTKIADLTVTEFKDLLHEAVAHSIVELLADPDQGLELRDNFAAELERSLADLSVGAETTDLADFADRFDPSHRR